MKYAKIDSLQIFHGRPFYRELHELTEDIFDLVRNKTLSKEALGNRAAALYLLYALYCKQPCRPMVSKVRLLSIPDSEKYCVLLGSNSGIDGPVQRSQRVDETMSPRPALGASLRVVTASFGSCFLVRRIDKTCRDGKRHHGGKKSQCSGAVLSYRRSR